MKKRPYRNGCRGTRRPLAFLGGVTGQLVVPHEEALDSEQLSDGERDRARKSLRHTSETPVLLWKEAMVAQAEAARRAFLGERFSTCRRRSR